MKIVVSGGWSYGNIGDEAIATATDYLLRTYFPRASLVYTAYDAAVFESCHGIQAMPSVHCLLEQRIPDALDHSAVIRDPEKFGLGQFASLFDEDTLLLMSGGGYFTEGWESQFAARLAEIGIAKARGAKVALVGQSIGPVYTQKGKDALRQSLDLCDYLCVRDESTQGFLQGLGLKIPVELAPDVANVIADVIPGEQREHVVNIMPASFSGYVSVDAKKKANPLVEKIKKRLSISGIRYKTQMRKLVRLLAKEYRLQFVMSTQWSWDRKFVEYVCKGLDPARYTVIHSSTTEELCRKLSRGQFLVSTKMHPIIISASYGIGSIGIAYNFKVDDYMRLLGAQDRCFRIDRVNAEKMLSAIQKPGAQHVDAGKIKADVYAMMARMARIFGEKHE